MSAQIAKPQHAVQRAETLQQPTGQGLPWGLLYLAEGDGQRSGKR